MSFLRKGAFAYKGSQLYAEELNLSSIGDEIKTPCHVYSRCLDMHKANSRFRFFWQISRYGYLNGSWWHILHRKQLQENIRAYCQAFGRLNHRIGFAIKVQKFKQIIFSIFLGYKWNFPSLSALIPKANYNPALLRIINEEGLSAVAVSGNEVLQSIFFEICLLFLCLSVGFILEAQVRLALEVGFKGRDIFLNGCGKQHIVVLHFDLYKKEGSNLSS